MIQDLNNYQGLIGVAGIVVAIIGFFITNKNINKNKTDFKGKTRDYSPLNQTSINSVHNE